jgi:hypothetical protein
MEVARNSSRDLRILIKVSAFCNHAKELNFSTALLARYRIQTSFQIIVSSANPSPVDKSKRENTHVELCWTFEKKANRIRIARNTFPKTSVPFRPIFDGAK